MEFHILGPLEVLREGELVELGHAKQRAVLGVLLLHRGEVVSTERLVDELWGESPPPTATKAVQVYISRLRKALGDAAATIVRTQAPGYVFQPESDAVDADRFEWLLAQARRERENGDLAEAAVGYREGLALWRGRALGDLAFESFAANEAERLNEQRLEALTERIDCDLRVGRHGELVGELEALVAEHPLRESLRARLMLALYRSGRQADALEAYIDARRTLRDELGLVPSPELQRLQQEILCHDPTLEFEELPCQPEPAPTKSSSALAPRNRRQVGGAIVAGVVAAFCILGLTAFVVTRSGRDPRLIKPNSVGVIDPQKGIIVADIAVGVDPARITAASGSVWVGNVADETVSRIDVSSRNVVRTIATGAAPLTLAPGSKGVWFGSGVSAGRIDPEFNVVVDRRAIPYPQPVGGAPLAVAEGVWLPAGDGVAHVDPTSGRIDDSVATGTDGPSSIAVGAGAVWVAQPDDKAIVRIGRSRLLTPIRLSASPTAVAVGEGAVWAVTTGDTLIRIDPAAAAVVTTIRVGARPTGVAIGGGSVWVANGLAGTISQVDPRRSAVVRTINVGNSPQGVAWVDGELWVPVQARASQSVGPKPGGTLRVEAQLPSFGGFDPALNFTTYGAQFDYATCLQLLNHPDAGVPTGTQLEPEAATSLPAVSRDKRSYTFTIRDGFRFSPPSRQTVTAETFRYSIERSLNPRMKSYARNIFDDIAGVSPFEARRARHISGITVRGSRLTIRLAKPSPDFLERVSTPFFCAVPIGTPINPRGVREIPAAGPYYVDSEHATQVVLKRNPNYGGSRPRRLDRIVLTLGRSQEKIVADIQSGRADYALDGIPRSMIAPIAARYGPGSRAAAAGRQRYFEVTQPTVEYLVLNTQRPLFSHLRLRRAVNYAVDRKTLASLGGPSSDPSVNGPQIPTDHFLPPAIRGYQDARTYPLRPDTRTARRLAHGLRGTATMYSCDLDTCDEVAQTVRANLKSLGIDVIIKRWPIGEMYARERAPREPFDLGLAGWSADYADGGAFLSALFESSSIAKGSNTSRFAEAAWDRRFAAAARLAGPARERAYGELDLALARDAAPAVALAYRTRGDFFSARVGCQIEQPVAYGIDLAALCIS